MRIKGITRYNLAIAMDYINMQEIVLEAMEEHEQFDSIINANSSFLQAMAIDSLNPSCEQAKVLLEKAGICSFEPVLYPPSGITLKSEMHSDNTVSNKQQDYLKIYPNPTNNILFVEYGIVNFTADKSYFVEIIDMNGKLLEQIPISKIVDLISIDTKSLKPGNYILKLHNTTAKFTKQ